MSGVPRNLRIPIGSLVVRTPNVGTLVKTGTIGIVCYVSGEDPISEHSAVWVWWSSLHRLIQYYLNDHDIDVVAS